MSLSDDRFYNLKRLHAAFAISAIALLAATAWMIVADHGREWKRYQRTFRDQIEPRMGRTLAIEQIWLPELTINYNFRRVARFDRCTTCHQGIDKTWGKPAELETGRGLPQPYAPHPRLDLFVGQQSPHPMSDFGCTICHEGQGSATEFKFASHTPNDLEQRAGWRREHGWLWNRDWDFPMRPKRFAESGCLQCHHEVSELEPSQRFPDPPAPKLVAGYHLVRQLGCFGCHEIQGVTAAGERVGPDMRLEPTRQATGNVPPGTLRKVGPSLRDAAGKLDAAFIQSWLAQPSDFRPATRMPQFFGMHEHLDGKGLDAARRFEPVEIRAIAEYLLTARQPIAPLDSPAEVTVAASAERGKRLFQTQGCLACHMHADFPEAKSTQGPDLSRIGAKLGTPAGAKWLASWLRDPARHSPRTLMPNPMLGLVSLPAENGGAVADLVEYLLKGKDWKPRELPAFEQGDLDDLALLYLSKTFPRDLAEKYLREGIPASSAEQVQGDAAELTGKITRAKKLRYVARRTIRRRGCFGCHDIPCFENVSPIGPALSDWGRKQESLLAFEQVHQFVLDWEDRSASDVGDSAGRQAASGTQAIDHGFFVDALFSKRREGFLWQKLRDPRSFDYQRTATKGYNEQLLMGRFTLTDAEREAIITFVLGLVAEPPRERYVSHPDRRHQAIVEGRKVLDQYSCAQCHTLEMERWTIEAASQTPNDRGLVRAELVGMPQWDAQGKPEEGEDEDGNPVQSFTLWEPAAIAGKVWPVGGAGVLVSPKQIVKKRAALGGDFARLLYPLAIAQARAAGSAATVIEAWGWVPPALIHEGRTVQPGWLYDYLLEPTVIRPAAVLRMPKFNLSPAEAGKLVDYFAAVSGEEFPYPSDHRGRAARQGSVPPTDLPTLEKALRLVIDRKTYCAKCHLIGDFSPEGENPTVLAPNLERAGRRIRSEALRRWLANPRSVLPYTAMPVNFPPDQELGQEIFKGTSQEQLDGVLDFLLDYDGYMKRRTSVREMMGE